MGLRVTPVGAPLTLTLIVLVASAETAPLLCSRERARSVRAKSADDVPGFKVILASAHRRRSTVVAPSVEVRTPSVMVAVAGSPSIWSRSYISEPSLSIRLALIPAKLIDVLTLPTAEPDAPNVTPSATAVTVIGTTSSLEDSPPSKARMRTLPLPLALALERIVTCRVAASMTVISEPDTAWSIPSTVTTIVIPA